MIRLLMTIGFALVTTQAFAQVAVPKSYVDGEVIHADELNTNLEAIAGAVPPQRLHHRPNHQVGWLGLGLCGYAIF